MGHNESWAQRVMAHKSWGTTSHGAQLVMGHNEQALLHRFEVYGRRVYLVIQLKIIIYTSPVRSRLI